MKRVIRILKKDLIDPTCDRASNYDCLIARAIKRLVKRSVKVIVGVDWLTLNGERVRVPYEEGFRVFNATEPFSFTLNLPARYLRKKRTK